jgi:hypothetical protein
MILRALEFATEAKNIKPTIDAEKGTDDLIRSAQPVLMFHRGAIAYIYNLPKLIGGNVKWALDIWEQSQAKMEKFCFAAMLPSRAMALHYFNILMDIQRNPTESEELTYVRLQNVCKLDTGIYRSNTEIPFAKTLQAAYLVRQGKKEDAMGVLRQYVELALDILSDNNPYNDVLGFTLLADVLLHVGDITSAMGALAWVGEADRIAFRPMKLECPDLLGTCTLWKKREANKRIEQIRAEIAGCVNERFPRENFTPNKERCDAAAEICRELEAMELGGLWEEEVKEPQIEGETKATKGDEDAQMTGGVEGTNTIETPVDNTVAADLPEPREPKSEEKATEQGGDSETQPPGDIPLTGDGDNTSVGADGNSAINDKDAAKSMPEKEDPKARDRQPYTALKSWFKELEQLPESNDAYTHCQFAGRDCAALWGFNQEIYYCLYCDHMTICGTCLDQLRDKDADHYQDFHICNESHVWLKLPSWGHRVYEPPRTRGKEKKKAMRAWVGGRIPFCEEGKIYDGAAWSGYEEVDGDVFLARIRTEWKIVKGEAKDEDGTRSEENLTFEDSGWETDSDSGTDSDSKSGLRPKSPQAPADNDRLADAMNGGKNEVTGSGDADGAS